EEPKVERANDQKLGEAKEISPNELPMGRKSFAQSFVVQHQRDLHPGESDQKRSQQATSDRQIIEYRRQMAKLAKQQGQPERERRRRGIENSGDRFHGVQQALAPNIGEGRPMPGLQGELFEAQIGGGFQRRKDDELKSGVRQSEDGKDAPEPLKAEETAQAV